MPSVLEALFGYYCDRYGIATEATESSASEPRM